MLRVDGNLMLTKDECLSFARYISKSDLRHNSITSLFDDWVEDLEESQIQLEKINEENHESAD
jgi:hypothetical protein